MADALHFEQFNEAREQHRTDAASVRPLPQIDRKLHVPVVGCAFAHAVGVGVADGLAVLFADEIGVFRAERTDSSGKFRNRRHLVLKRDGRVRDIGRVDASKRLGVSLGRSANSNAHWVSAPYRDLSAKPWFRGSYKSGLLSAKTVTPRFRLSSMNSRSTPDTRLRNRAFSFERMVR